MNIHDTDVVPAIRDSLIRELGADRFDLWFGTRIRLSPIAGGIRFEAQNRFSLETVQKNFRGHIDRVVAQLSPSITVEYAVQPCLSVANHPAGNHSAANHVDNTTTKHTASITNTENPMGSVSRGCKLTRSVEETAVVGPLTSEANTLPTGRQIPTIQENSAERPDSAQRPELPKMEGSHSSRRRFARLETLIPGPCNELAITSARMALEEPGRVSPLFLHGPPGCGKSHLLEASWTRFRQRYPRRRVVYLSAEQFTTFFLAALHGKGLPSFRSKYREVDLLILDDVQFFCGKHATIVEVVNTLDSAARQGRQVLLAGDRPAAQMTELGQDFCTRIVGGLSCRMDPLNLEVRRNLVQQGALERQLALPDDVLSLVAEQIEGDGRQIRGILNVLWTHQQTHRTPITTATTQKILDEIYGDHIRLVQLGEIERIVCEVFGLDRKSLQSAGRTQQLAQPRMLAMWLARRYTPSGLTEISKHFGRSSHTTVISAEKRVAEWIENGAQIRLGAESHRIRDVVRRIERRLRAG
ncbi:MAG: DnaA/Hda family protein [Planctomycetota bacterium]|nr:DnaA/Hda family protein [Planctomycetota bacterium]